NRNGAQDAGEPGIDGVTVSLYVGSTPNIPPTAVAITGPNPNKPAADGYYQFIGLTPGVPYLVCFETPTGFTRTAQFQGGDDTLDSNMDVLTGCAPVVTLADNESNQTIDAGFFQTPATGNGSLSGIVFEDCDADGRPDEGESGIKGVTLTLTGPGGTRTV